ncbi:WD40/YVTN/BNR-like repeat-containing protein [Pseudoxanthomonas wuyuanensis]
MVALSVLFGLVAGLPACGDGGRTSSPSSSPASKPAAVAATTTVTAAATTAAAAEPATSPPRIMAGPLPARLIPTSYRWSNVAMGGGGYVSAVIPSKTERNLVYARTDVGGAYRWDHATGRWIPLHDFLSEEDVGLMGIESIALDPKDSAVVYALAGTSYFSGGKTAVMRSSDYGATFSRVTDVTAQFRVHGNGMGRGNGEKMQVDPGNSNVLYVGSRNNGLFKSTDAGVSFVRVGSLPVTTTPNEAGISFVLPDPSSVAGGVAQRIFVGVSRYGSVGPNLYRSDNAGSTFTPVASAPADYMPQRAALAGDGNLYLTYGNGAGPHGNWSQPEPMDAGQVWRYNVASGGWTNVTPTGINGAFSGVSVDPNNPQRVLVSTINTWMQQGNNWGDQFLLTTNGGGSWTNVVERGFMLDTDGVTWIAGNSIHWASSIEFDPFDTRSAWVTSGNGVFRSANIEASPATWTFAVRGLEETVPLGLVSVPGGPLLSVIGDYDGFRHTNIDAYAPIHTPRMGTTTGLAVAAANTPVVVRAGIKQVFRSTDTGATWTEVSTKLPSDSSNTRDSVVALSANGGTLLHAIRIGDTTTTYRSTNFTSASPTWTTVTGLGTNALRPAADPVNANKFYAYDNSNGAVLVSTNGGSSFAVAATLATGGSTWIRPAPGREGDVWVALRSGGLSRSTNSGASFVKLPNVTDCSAVGFGRPMRWASYPTVFIWGAVDGGKRGLYRSTDQGASWIRINDDAHQFGGPGNAQFVVGDMNIEGVVYMSTVGRGIVYGTPAATQVSGLSLPKTVQFRSESLKVERGR